MLTLSSAGGRGRIKQGMMMKRTATTTTTTIPSPSLMFLLCTTFIAALLAAVPGARGQVLTPPYFNLAEGRRITATATCGFGVSDPELYCKLVGAHSDLKDNPNVNLIQGQVCDYCDPHNPSLAHPPENAIDGTERWWQSPPLSRGNTFNSVNLTIDLGQEFHVAYVFIKMANSPRPGIWALERSTNHGKKWDAWQYFADTPSDCVNYFGRETMEPITRDDSVVCETKFSKVVPLEGGEIVVSLLNDRPSAHNFYNSSVLQEWTKATNIRLRLIRTKTLLGHLMSVARQDPTVTRRYYYSIRDISIGGRCVCNGHADTCDIADPNDLYELLCRCQHNTCGAQCESCCPGYVQKKWRPATHYSENACEACNCFGHADECEYDEETDRLNLSLDVLGQYEGGGVCQHCRHNTEGVNCNRCRPGYFRPYGKFLNATDVCHQCKCEVFYSTGSCFEGSGQCECRPEFFPPLCDQCNLGYFGYPNCRPCDCHLNGTRGSVCEVGGGQCPCKVNYMGKNCDQCSEGYYNFPECLPCDCNQLGAVVSTCDVESGQCTCRNNYGGRTCSECDAGFHGYPNCQFCDCDHTGTVPDVCDKGNGSCICKAGYGGSRCDQCAPGYFGYPNCKSCNCQKEGSVANTCDETGKCHCLHNFAGLTCHQCLPGYYRYPECLSCNCDGAGSIGVSCDLEGRCQCRPNFDGVTCNACKQGFYNYPACEECNCDPAGVLQTFGGCGTLTTGELCQCKERVSGRVCNQCRPLYWNLKASNPQGCEDCNCHLPGTIGGINVCDGATGQCLCKPNAALRRCDQCRDGTCHLEEDNLFGCRDCGCDVGGAMSPVCDKSSGQCACRPRISGQTCSEPHQLHYFANLYHLQYEIEDGRTPANTPARFGYSDHDFSGYSWRGYGIFSPLQREVQMTVYIEKPSIYRVVLRYVNHGLEAVVGHVTFTPHTSADILQTSPVRFEATTRPTLVTASGAENASPSHFVLNPGQWIVSIKVDKPLLLDYFVLLPSAYYEATLLHEHVNIPCKLGLEFGSCRHYLYAEVDDFPTVRCSAGTVAVNDERVPTQKYSNEELMNILELDNGGQMALLDENQRDVRVELTLPKTGRYVLVVIYYTPEGGRTSTLHVETSSTTGRDKGRAILYDCMYTTVCRQAVTDLSGRVIVFNFENNDVTLHLKGPDNTSVAIDSVVAIPVRQWHTDYIRPKPACVRQDDRCLDSQFHVVPGTIKVEVEANNEDRKAKILPPHIHDDTIGLVYLDHKDSMVDVIGKVSESGDYVFLVHYYQPRHPEFDLDVIIQNGAFYEAVLPVPFCPSTYGCRAIVKTKDGETKFQILERFIISLKEPNHKNVWVDYILAIPAELYKPEVLVEMPLDRAVDFITRCGPNHFHMDDNVDGFCRDATFSLTSEYNNGGLPCQCNFDGSESFECEKFGGQCPCRPNAIGRTCSECRTGYFGFPNCQACSCPSTAICHPETGECICPPRVIGEKCDACRPNTYGFDPIIGCEECNCNYLGVQQENLQCDLLTGSCECKPNVVGRTCDMCKPGYWAFPFCQLCDCDLRGTTEDICDQENARCYCKDNVYGPTCDQCKPGTFYLQEQNPAGCTKCFCFGRTDRCTSSSLYRIQVGEVDGWIAIALNPTTAAVDASEVFETEIQIATVNVVIPSSLPANKVIYFSAPVEYLGNMITSYGGHLRYTITYNTQGSNTVLDSRSLILPDVILVGNNMTLVYEHVEQPSSSIPLDIEVNLLEYNFHHLTGGAVSREQIMLVLYNLDAIYIRAQYNTGAFDASLDRTLLDIAVSTYVADTSQALAVEQCQCPPNYEGSSCEECAPGFYRAQTGPHGGYCVQCQCHGHADTCDRVTGRCLACKHNTTGEHCDKCVAGFHGDATRGTPYDCLICACPLPTMSNNFAVSCEFSPSGLEIHCDCKPGYYGPRCNHCAAGYYGRPEQIGETCKPCQCSGNIDTSVFGTCDSLTGECLKCLNDTHGAACELCAPGFYGDAIGTRNCKRCHCDACGTRDCHHGSGHCRCHPNVIGDKCEECAAGFWRFNSCDGCIGCECGEASESSQCDVNTGQCRCRNGVTGRTCNQCMAGFWRYSTHGCEACRCNEEYSIGGSCNPKTGQCECLPGVIGERCDRCPYRWVLIENVGCHECGTCVHVLLDDVDLMRAKLDPVRRELEGVSLTYFAYQRLYHINKTVTELAPLVELLILDPSAVDVAPLERQVISLEQDSKHMDRNATATITKAADTSDEANGVRIEALALEKMIRDIAYDAAGIVDDIRDMSHRIVSGKGPDVDRKIAEAERLFGEIKRRDFEYPRERAEDEDGAANDTLARAKKFYLPVKRHQEKVDGLKEELGDLREKLRELMNISRNVLDKANTAKGLYAKNKVPAIKHRIEQLEDGVKMINDLFDDGNDLLDKARALLEEARNLFTDALDFDDDLGRQVALLTKKVAQLQSDVEDVKPKVLEAEIHAQNLMAAASELDGLLADTRQTSENAVKAANARANIVEGINEALKAAEDAVEAADKAKNISTGMDEKADKSKAISLDLLRNATEAKRKVHPPLAERMDHAQKDVQNVADTNKRNRHDLDELKRGMERLAANPLQASAQAAEEAADAAGDKAEKALENVEKISDTLPEYLIRAEQVPRDIDEANKAIKRSFGQVEKALSAIPEIESLMNRIGQKNKSISITGVDVGDKIAELRRKIALARDKANRIKLGVHFTPDVTLQLQNPDGLANSATYSKLSMYFRTDKKNGFLAYLGNEIGTNKRMRRALTDDYMAITVENGRCVLTMDMGSGFRRIYNQQDVDDNQWHQVIAERTGKSATLTVRTEEEEDVIAEGTLPGTHAVFNLDQELSKLYVGGIPEHANVQPEVSYRRFEGDIEELAFENSPIGLWNFGYSQHNREGCHERDKLVVEKPSTGLRFDGSGYAIMSKRSSDKFEKRVEVILQFRTYASEGLLFLIGKEPDYFALSLRGGRVYLQYDLGNGKAELPSPEGTQYNDGSWHMVQVNRQNKDAILWVDGQDLGSTKSPGRLEDLSVTNEIYVGGYPGNHSFKGITNVDFEGCIDNMQIGTSLLDLNKNKEALGVVAGCPAKVARSVSFSDDSKGYLGMPGANMRHYAQFTFKFKTSEQSGLLFYTANDDKSNYISVSLHEGVIVFRCNPGGEVRTGSATMYNDKEWHYVTATRENEELRLDIDDYEVFTETGGRGQIITTTPIYVGGVPVLYTIPSGSAASTKYLKGCIGDVTVNGIFQNFANTTDRVGGSLASCPIADPMPTQATVDTGFHIVPITTTPYDVDYEDIQVTQPVTVRPGRTRRPTTPRQRGPTTPQPTPVGQCALPLRPLGDPDLTELSGIRFGLADKSYQEYIVPTSRFRSETLIALEFKTDSAAGILFYLTDKSYADFVALYILNGKLYFALNMGSGIAQFHGAKSYNDGMWHSVKVSRQSKSVRLTVDEEIVANKMAEGQATTMEAVNPLYIGGVSEATNKFSKQHLRGIERSLDGCIRNIVVLNEPVESPREDINTQPCSDKVEPGSFFSMQGGHLVLYDNFRVGVDLEMFLEIKPRDLSGVILSVHGLRGDFLTLQLVDGAILFRVDNGAGIITARYAPENKYTLCNGQWHKIQAIKTKNVLMLSVNGQFMEPGIGPAGVSATDTNDPLYFGGIPSTSSRKGIETTAQFVGCIRNVQINKAAKVLAEGRAVGNITMNVCPTI